MFWLDILSSNPRAVLADSQFDTSATRGDLQCVREYSVLLVAGRLDAGKRTNSRPQLIEKYFVAICYSKLDVFSLHVGVTRFRRALAVI